MTTWQPSSPLSGSDPRATTDEKRPGAGYTWPGPVLGIRLALLCAGAALVASAATDASAQAPEPKPAWQQAHPAAAAQTRWVPGKGLEFDSADRMFRLQIRPRVQFLYELEDAQGEGDTRERSQSILVRRARLSFAGKMWGEKLDFKMELALSPNDLGMTDNKHGNAPITNKDNTVSRSPLLDFYVQFNQIRDLNLRVGQYKVQYSRQRVVSSGDMMFVDRAIASAEFNVDRDIGLDLRSKDLFGLDKKLRYTLGISSGEGHSSFAANDFGMMYLARLEALPLGDFDDFVESDQTREARPRLSLGLGAAWIENGAGNKGVIGKRPADGGVTDTRNLTADAVFKMAGASLATEVFWRKGTRQAGSKVDAQGKPVAMEKARNGWGAQVQGGYLLGAMPLEFAGCYALVRGTGDDTSLGDANEAGVAVNYYFAGHALKLQADVRRLWGDAFSKADNQGRLQLQAAF